MSGSSRRAFLGQIGSAAIAIPALGKGPFGIGAAPSQAAPPAQASAAAASYDLLIAGGRVIDPSQKLSAERDVAISGGKIAKVAANIPRDQARQVFDAKGKLVTPGLIDIHTHVYRYVGSLGLDSDVVGFQAGVTTLVDAGSAGATTFDGLRKYVIDGAATRIYALLNISSIGLVVFNEAYVDSKLIDAKAAIRTILANRDRILGIKVRINGDHKELAHDLQVLKTAREAADATGLPIMMHWSVEPELLALLKKGDILTHPFNVPGPEQSNAFGRAGEQSEKVLPQILALKDRGIWTDGQFGTTHHTWVGSEKAVRQGWVPDLISTDTSRAADGAPASVLVPMTAALHLGIPLEQVIATVTANPAKALNYPEKIGTLEPGVNADVAILDLVQGNFKSAPDRLQQTRTFTQQLLPVATLKNGIFLKGAPTPAARG